MVFVAEVDAHMTHWWDLTPYDCIVRPSPVPHELVEWDDLMAELWIQIDIYNADIDMLDRWENEGGQC